MNSRPRYAACLSVAACLLVSCALLAETHVIMVGDDYFSPKEITIAPGDTVRWETIASNLARHNVDSDNALWDEEPVRPHPWSLEHTFAKEGEFGFHCDSHIIFGMVGTVTVGDIGGGEEPGIDINAGQNGNWWSGLIRNGEGAQVEIAKAAGGGLVLVITVYSYDPFGNQIFLIAVGTPDGDTAEIDVYITEGPMWGDDFDPNDTNETQWGTGVFKSNTCDSVELTLTPNAEYQAEGYTEITLDLERLLPPPIIDCPIE